MRENSVFRGHLTFHNDSSSISPRFVTKVVGFRITQNLSISCFLADRCSKFLARKPKLTAFFHNILENKYV